MPRGTGEPDAPIVVRRVFDAPRAVVFDAWTNPARLTEWWAPEGCTTTHCTVEPGIGGAFHFCIRLPDGVDVWGLGRYREFEPNERLVYVDAFSDEDGEVVSPTEYGMSEEHPLETLVTVEFADHAGGTRVTLTHGIDADVPEYEATAKGWSDMFEQLAGELDRVRRTKR